MPFLNAWERGWELRPYQLKARDWLRAKPRSALFLDMGLGKTASVLSALTDDHLPVLVIAPKRVAETVWPTEVKLWRDDLDVVLAAGSPTDRHAALRADTDIVVMGVDNIKDLVSRNDKRRLKLNLKRDEPFRTIVLDELSMYKGRGERFKILKAFSKTTPHVWGLTGTPSPNGLIDLWGQIGLLDRGERCGKTIEWWRTRFFTPGRRLPNGVISNWRINPGADEEIYSLIEDICLSMRAAGRIKIPEVTFNAVPVELPAKVERIYDKMQTEYTVRLGGKDYAAANDAHISNKLAQISAGFLFGPDADIDPSDYLWLHDAKLKAAREVVDSAQGSGVLMLYSYLPELAALKKAFPEARTIDEPRVIDDWNHGDVPVLLAHPASVGHGLNLQHGGHTVVWVSLTWSQELWSQANARLPRSGQKHPVVIHTLMASEVDGVILDALRRKVDVTEALLNYLEAAA